MMNNQSTVSKVYLDKGWYVPVDQSGHLIGDSFEGALGCVLRLYKDGDDPSAPKQFRAMKLPRLVADTLQENAYIVEMHEAEVSTVIDLQDGKEQLPGLLELAATAQNDLKSPLWLAESGELKDLRRYSMTLFRFDKNERVQVRQIFVEIDGGTKQTCPGETPSDLEACASELVEVAVRARKNNHEDPGVVVLSLTEASSDDHERSKSASSPPSVRALSEALNGSDPASRWYAFLPSVTFRWADTTLQRAISNNERGSWKAEQHLLLIQKLLAGLNSLHKSKKLHGDIRPANVMCVGDATDPRKYVLGDYGSFCFDRPRLGQGGGAGSTLVGPKLSSDRVSPFYSPERRAGTENEAADCAFVLDLATLPKSGTVHDPRHDYYLVRLGWRKHLSNSGKPREGLEEETLAFLDMKKDGRPCLRMKSSEGEMKETAQPKNTLRPEIENGLRPGDRVRLRDHLFIVAESGYWESDRILLCTKPSWRVLHDSLVIPFRAKEGDSRLEASDARPLEQGAEGSPDGERASAFLDRSLLNIAAVTEFHSWSAATDLYGIGAVFLYSVFRSTQERAEEAVQDQKFAEMLAAFESVSYFRTVWDRLETLRQSLEQAYDEKASLEIPPPKVGEGQGTKEGKARSQVQNSGLWARAMVSVNNIVKTAPGARRLLISLDRNLADFCFVLHFSLSCIHRRSSLKERERKAAVDSGFPFCHDRTEPAAAMGVASKAEARLERLIQMRQSSFFDKFVAPLDEISKYEPADPLLREYTEADLRRQVNEANAWITKAKEDLELASNELSQVKQALTRKDREYAVQADEMRQLRADESRAKHSLATTEKRLAAREAALAEILGNLRGLVAEVDGLSSMESELRPTEVRVHKGPFQNEPLQVYELTPVNQHRSWLKARSAEIKKKIEAAVSKVPHARD